MDYMRLGTDLAIGGVVGALDQYVQDVDDKRAKTYVTENPGKTHLPVLRQYGTYLNYGAPILASAAVALGYLRGDMQTKIVTASGQLAGRKATHYFLYKDVSAAAVAKRGIAPWMPLAPKNAYDITTTNETIGSTLLT